MSWNRVEGVSSPEGLRSGLRRAGSARSHVPCSARGALPPLLLTAEVHPGISLAPRGAPGPPPARLPREALKDTEQTRVGDKVRQLLRKDPRVVDEAGPELHRRLLHWLAIPPAAELSPDEEEVVAGRELQVGARGVGLVEHVQRAQRRAVHRPFRRVPDRVAWDKLGCGEPPAAVVAA
uniref:Uncharacterized protein n=1 Tax=Tetraselmis sp. GSL018 TaxID=582737 RepID=A0A061S1U4_9CHLO|eukprot:CAMPEP_0177609250 /NCGR_PEP_ID=MMETSP0419_2-20121207/18965_1 /TAXON_ID=582737 /ORGANISM="Tetraselmis sp., Strain GSL018" /LENGTH=178 /DNA_ID=CAMNT_0019104115 /DNA_START=92 /DNA_END=628 /DNA_ORIENTATION=-